MSRARRLLDKLAATEQISAAWEAMRAPPPRRVSLGRYDLEGACPWPQLAELRHPARSMLEAELGRAAARSLIALLSRPAERAEA